jgi:PPOX class probable F420-dependent enzyme
LAELTDAQIALLRDQNFGVVATLKPDGSPQTSVVWIDTDGEHVIFNTVIGRAKEKHLRRDPRVSVVVLPAEDQQSGYVSVTGTGELVEDGAFEHIDKMALKYLGLEKYPYLQPGEQRVIVKVTPDKVDAFGIE